MNGNPANSALVTPPNGVYKGINPLLNGGVKSAVELHPHYRQKLAGNSSLVNRPASNFPASNAGEGEAGAVFNPATLVSADQTQYFSNNFDLTRNPTRFNVQNAGLKIGGAPMQIHQQALGESHPPAATPHPNTAPPTPMPDISQIYRNPAPFDFGDAVRSTHPQRPVTFPDESIQRMMRSPDEVDPGLVTNPIPSKTFMDRMPRFDKAPEDAATQRWRTQTNGSMRFW